MTSAPHDPSDEELVALLLRSRALLADDVPVWATQRALNVWRAPVLSAPAAGGLLQQLAAVLRFDSWGKDPSLALRSREADARQLLYSAGPHDIDLRLRPLAGEPARFEITGQVLGPAAQGWAEWRPEPQSAAITKALVDEFGEFLLVGLPPGFGAVHLLLDGRRVELPVVELGGPASGTVSGP